MSFVSAVIDSYDPEADPEVLCPVCRRDGKPHYDTCGGSSEEQHHELLVRHKKRVWKFSKQNMKDHPPQPWRDREDSFPFIRNATGGTNGKTVLHAFSVFIQGQ